MHTDYWQRCPASWIAPGGTRAEQAAIRAGAQKPLLYQGIVLQRDRDLLCDVLSDLTADATLTHGNFGSRVLERIRERGATSGQDEERAQLHRLAQVVSAQLHHLGDLWARWQAVKAGEPAP